MNRTRVALFRGIAAAGRRERERRNEAAWLRLLDKIELMAERLMAEPQPRDPELARHVAEAKDWVRVDELRIPLGMAPAEAVALAWSVDPDAAGRLLRLRLDEPAGQP